MERGEWARFVCVYLCLRERQREKRREERTHKEAVEEKREKREGRQAIYGLGSSSFDEGQLNNG